MATGSKDQAWAGARSDSTHRRGPSWSLVVGGLVILAAIAALLGVGGSGSRDVGTTASTPITTSPPTDHPAVTEPTRPTPLPPR